MLYYVTVIVIVDKNNYYKIIIIQNNMQMKTKSIVIDVDKSFDMLRTR